jgi:hypothetical protein
MEIRWQWCYTPHASRKSLISRIIFRKIDESTAQQTLYASYTTKVMRTKLLAITAITILNSFFITSGASKALAEPVRADIDQAPAIINIAKQEFKVRVRLASNNPRSCQDLKPYLFVRESVTTNIKGPAFAYTGEMFGLEKNDPPTSCLATFKVDSKYKGKTAYLRFEAGNSFCRDVNQRSRDINISVTVLGEPMDIKLDCSSRTRR